MMISALVLAGGASRRMGTPKALLPIYGTTFLRHIVTTIRAAGISDVAVVLGADAARIRPTMAWFNGIIVENTEWEKGQLSSVCAGLACLAERAVDGALVWPVDHPTIGPDVATDMLRAFESSGKGIILPLHAGRRGHPVLFAARMFSLLRAASLDAGAREVIHAHSEEICEIVTPDAGVLRNIDTLEEFLQCRQAPMIV